MDIRYFIGIDIAKATLDWAVYDSKKMILQTSTSNTIAGIKTALRLLKSFPEQNPQQAVFLHGAYRSGGPSVFTMPTCLIFSINFTFPFG